ncbi:MAG: hypothetical protein M1326_07225 [Cyanobacteria bacterium]|nr:hypothetical protein [Cyanobacteriota bacterium]
MFQNKTEELNKMLENFDNHHTEWLRRFAFFMGRRARKLNNPVGRWIIKNITTRLFAHLILKYHLLDIRKKKNMSLIDIALEWLKPSIFFKIPTIIESATDERVVVLRPECTIGLNEPSCAKLCRASMNMDMIIIDKLGGKLTVTETILEGAKYCRHIIELKN